MLSPGQLSPSFRATVTKETHPGKKRKVSKYENKNSTYQQFNDALAPSLPSGRKISHPAGTRLLRVVTRSASYRPGQRFA